jgi:alpha-methylacyl-CoA racemase
MPFAMAGPLSGIRVVELSAMGPVPFAGMLLSDMGADVVRVDRVDPNDRRASSDATAVLDRGRRSIAVDLKQQCGTGVVLRLVEQADVLVEGFRPGVAERLGIGPEECCRRNSGLIYARMTGWGQTGPYAQMAGHDINYIALGGALAHFGRGSADPPVTPLNLVADFGGGGMLLAFGIASALVERSRSGRGQILDVAMIDGVATLMAPFWGQRHAGQFDELRGTHALSGAAPFYDSYETADGGFVAVGAIEPQFYRELCIRVGLDPAALPDQNDRSSWPEMKERFAALFKTRTRAQWSAVLHGTDACFAPVLPMSEAAHHPQVQKRRTVVEVDGVAQPAPAPRFSRTPGAIARPPAQAGQHTSEVLAEWAFTPAELADLRARGAIA